MQTPTEPRQTRLRWRWLGLGVAALALTMAACTSETGTTTTVDCVATGTCSEGPPLDSLPSIDPIVPATAASAVEGSHDGLPVGFTAEGYPFIGAPDAAISVIEFSDYLCPFCYRHNTETAPALLEQYASTGAVNFIFRDFPLAGLHPTAPTGHSAAQCVAEQGAQIYWEYHELLFANQPQWAGLPDPTGYLASSAEAVGADMDAYQECMDSGRTSVLVAQRVAEAQAEGFSGTPSFRIVVNADGASHDIAGAVGFDRFAATLDALIAGDDLAALESGGDVSEAQDPVIFTADPSSQDEYMGLPVGFTAEGFPYIGDPDATVSVVEFSDYLCPFCFRHTTQTAPALLDTYAGGGGVNFVFRDLPLASLHPTAPQGHAAALCVAEQGAAFFWAFHDTLFFNQQAWADLSDPGEYLEARAGDVGVDVAAYRQCVASGRTAAEVEARVAEGLGAGYEGTPSFEFVDTTTGSSYRLVGAQPFEAFAGYIDAMLAGEAPPGAAPGLPRWATADGLAPDPARPGYTSAGDAFKGAPDAPVVVVEFGDFQCPSCGQHALEVQPAIDAQLVDSGQVLWVFKHLPVAGHPQAAVAAAAAECAGDQDSFWEMHDLLYATVDEWSVADADGALAALAGRLGLDEAEFRSCLAGREPLERVLADLYDAQGFVDQVPTFIVVYGEQGRRLVGTLSAEEFVTILEEQIDLATR